MSRASSYNSYMKKVVVMLLISAVIGVLAYYVQRKETPVVNQNQKNRVLLEFTFLKNPPPTLELTGGFITNNEECNKTIRIFGIIPVTEVERYAKVPTPIPIKISGNKGIAVVYGDYFYPGYCDWQLATLTVARPQSAMRNTEYRNLNLLLPNPVNNFPRINYQYECTFSPKCSCAGSEREKFKKETIEFTVRRVD